MYTSDQWESWWLTFQVVLKWSDDFDVCGISCLEVAHTAPNRSVGYTEKGRTSVTSGKWIRSAIITKSTLQSFIRLTLCNSAQTTSMESSTRISTFNLYLYLDLARLCCSSLLVLCVVALWLWSFLTGCTFSLQNLFELYVPHPTRWKERSWLHFHHKADITASHVYCCYQRISYMRLQFLVRNTLCKTSY